MRKLLYLIFLNFCFLMTGQQMNSDKLGVLISQVADSSITNGNSYNFIYKNRPLICVYDNRANRMRIISPIIKREEIGEDELLNTLVANFHSALDVKYALSDEIIWSVFTHPLRELSDGQVLDAIDQVYTASITFGTSYSSTSLVFPGNSKKEEKRLLKRID